MIPQNISVPQKHLNIWQRGKPVISTSITDVVNPYGINKLVHIADTADDFIRAAEKELNRKDRINGLRK